MKSLAKVEELSKSVIAPKNEVHSCYKKLEQLMKSSKIKRSKKKAKILAVQAKTERRALTLAYARFCAEFLLRRISIKS